MWFLLLLYIRLSLCPALCDPVDYSTPGIPSPSPGPCSNSCPLSRWCHPNISSSVVSYSSCLQSFPTSVSFPRVSSSNQLAKVLQFRHQSFQWIFRIAFLRIDWFGLLAIQGNLKSVLQHHNSKASILQPSAFFMVQLSRLYITTGKTIALTLQTFVSKVISLLLNTLSKFVNGEGNDNPLQCSRLENPRDRGAWWAASYGIAQSRTWLKWLSSLAGLS